MELASLVEKMDTTVQNAQSERRTKKEKATGTTKDCSKHREKGNSISVNSECTSKESSLKNDSDPEGLEEFLDKAEDEGF